MVWTTLFLVDDKKTNSHEKTATQTNYEKIERMERNIITSTGAAHVDAYLEYRM